MESMSTLSSLESSELPSSPYTRQCSKNGCKATLPPASVYVYVQCESCREKGREAMRVFNERKRTKRESASGIRNGSSKTQAIETGAFVREPSLTTLPSSASPCSLINHQTPNPSGNDHDNSDSPRVCTRMKCGVILPAFNIYPYVQCAACKEHGRAMNAAVRERKRKRSEEDQQQHVKASEEIQTAEDIAHENEVMASSSSFIPAITTATSPGVNASQDASSIRICSRRCCDNTLPELASYHYIQCASCREKGRLDARAYSERQREKMRGGGINVEDEELDGPESSRSGSESVAVMEHTPSDVGPSHASSRSSIISPVTPTSATDNSSSTSTERRCTRIGCGVPLPPLSVYKYVQCANCKEKQGIAYKKWKEKKAWREREASGESVMENTPSNTRFSQTSSPVSIISPVTPTSGTDSLSLTSTQRRCTRIGCGVILPTLPEYKYVQCPECREKQRVATKKWQEKKKSREREAFSGQSSSANMNAAKLSTMRSPDGTAQDPVTPTSEPKYSFKITFPSTSNTAPTTHANLSCLLDDLRTRLEQPPSSADDSSGPFIYHASFPHIITERVFLLAATRDIMNRIGSVTGHEYVRYGGTSTSRRNNSFRLRSYYRCSLEQKAQRSSATSPSKTPSHSCGTNVVVSCTSQLGPGDSAPHESDSVSVRGPQVEKPSTGVLREGSRPEDIRQKETGVNPIDGGQETSTTDAVEKDMAEMEAEKANEAGVAEVEETPKLYTITIRLSMDRPQNHTSQSSVDRSSSQSSTTRIGEFEGAQHGMSISSVDDGMIAGSENDESHDIRMQTEDIEDEDEVGRMVIESSARSDVDGSSSTATDVDVDIDVDAKMQSSEEVDLDNMVLLYPED